MERKTNWKLGTRLLVLLCLMGAGLIVASAGCAFVVNMGMLTMLTVQDVLAFIVPAVAAMALFYRRPLHAMCMDRAPEWRALLVVVAFYILSMPATNWLVTANEAMTLPSWMSGIEQLMRALEDSASDATEKLLDINTVGQLIPCVFVVGLMAGLSEEMLFRGAIIFSAFHMQFYGFFPRMILGVWLGYLLLWTRSLWVPIIAHTLNNSTVVMFSYLTNKGIVPEGFGDNLGLPADGGIPWLAIASLVASLALAIWTARYYKRRQSPPPLPV